MAILKCKMCGGDIELSADKTFGTCEYCGSTMTFPRVDDEQRANRFNRGNQFRRAGEFDKALAVYEQIVQEDENDAEAHWCCALCRFGIEYVEDPNTLEYLPTCHRASFDSFLEDPDYLAALAHSDGVTKRQYQKDAAKIAEVQREILATSQNEEPFDVFICYKESEDDGSRTRDSLYAQDIYYQLTEQGRRVFFSRITLEDKAGTEYEPYIFAALNSAKVMVLVTTSAEHANAVWVKNEWSRFLSLMRKDRSKLLLPCYRDMDPYDLPEALSVLQSYDMSKIGFIQDLIRGVNKVLEGSKPKQAVKETVVVQQQSGYAAPLLERAFMFLEDGDWAKADDFCEQVLNLEPKNALAYLGKLMAELKVRNREQLQDQPQPFDDQNSYQKAIRFGDDALKKELIGAVKTIQIRIKEEQRRAEEARKEGIYQKALQCVREQRNKNAQDLFDSIPDYKDANAQSEACQHRIAEIRAQAEAARQETERKAEEERIAAKKAARRQKKKNRVTALALALLAILSIGAYSLWTKVIQPNQQYSAAVTLYEAGQYEEAIATFEALNGYKDSATLLDSSKVAAKEAKDAASYTAALELYNAGKYEEAITAFKALDGYQDSVSQIEICQLAIKEQNYTAAIDLYNIDRYDEAIAAFTALNGYKDCEAQIENCYIGKYGKEAYDSVKSARVGKTFLFGTYEQDNVASNGKEDIEWVVLKKEDLSLLLISKYALDCKPFSTSRPGSAGITWETCSLRAWLNDTFFNTAFSVDEQKLIATTIVTADENPDPSYNVYPGSDSKDKVFLLSVLEATQYYRSAEVRKCVPTTYAIAQGAFANSDYTVDGRATCWWWLRTPGSYSCTAALVSVDGSLNTRGNYVYVDYGTVRPAMWISIGR